MEDMVEIGPSEGKGLGLFARTFIRRGTRIMAERHLMHLHEGPSQSVVAFRSLSPDEKTQYLSLHAVSGTTAPTLYDPDVTISDDTIQDIFTSNYYTLISDDECILAPKLSRVNHSCLPNVINSYLEEDDTSTLWAVRDIIAGEEITLSYVDEFAGYEERKRDLRQYWDLLCDCEACDITSEFGRTSDCRRVVLHRNHQDIDRYFDEHLDQGLPKPFQKGERMACTAVVEAMNLTILKASPSRKLFTDSEETRRALNQVLETLDLIRLEGLPRFETLYLAKAVNLAANLGEVDAAINFMISLLDVDALFESGHKDSPDYPMSAGSRLEMLTILRDVVD